MENIRVCSFFKCAFISYPFQISLGFLMSFKNSIYKRHFLNGIFEVDLLTKVRSSGALEKSLNLLLVKRLEASGNTGDCPTSEQWTSRDVFWRPMVGSKMTKWQHFACGGSTCWTPTLPSYFSISPLPPRGKRMAIIFIILNEVKSLNKYNFSRANKHFFNFGGEQVIKKYKDSYLFLRYKKVFLYHVIFINRSL